MRVQAHLSISLALVGILLVLGARPAVLSAAPLSRALPQRPSGRVSSQHTRQAPGHGTAKSARLGTSGSHPPPHGREHPAHGRSTVQTGRRRAPRSGATPLQHTHNTARPADRGRSAKLRRVRTRTSVQKPDGTPAALTQTHVQATSADFMKAAQSHETPSDAALTDAPNFSQSGPGALPASTAAPVSVISTVRNADTRGLNKPQLPSVADLVAEPVILPTLYNKRGRLIVPPALKGSHEILIHQNVMADSDGLARVRDDEDLARMRLSGMLVAIPTNSMMHIDERLPANRRYCRPWTALFLDTLARSHYAYFQSALQVNSAVRTVEFQQRLIHTNGNAAPAEGDTASPHLTGQAIDIAKRGLSMAEIAWLRGYLLPLVQQGKVDVEEEFQQSCFHISVYRQYLPPAGAGRRVIATTHREGMGALGMSLR